MSATKPPATSSRPLFRLYLGLGLFFLVVGVIFAFGDVGQTAAGVGFTAFGALFALIGLFGLRVGAGVQLINTSLNLLAQGRLREAEKLLVEAEKLANTGPNRRAIDTQRAMIATRRGDLDGALVAIDRAAAEPRRARSILREGMHLANARGIRAFLRASKGDREGAMADVAFVRKSPESPPQALARAAVAEAIVIERSGDKGALREQLTRERTILREGTSPRERAIIRAFQRMLSAPTTSVYRKSAAREPERAPGEEPAVADWVAAIAPSAAPFVRAGRPSAAGREKLPLGPGEVTAAGEEARTASRRAMAAQGKKLFWKGAGRRLGLLFSGTGAILGVAYFLAGSPEVSRTVAPSSADDVLWTVSRLAAAVAFAGIGVLVHAALRARRHLLAMQKASAGVLRGDAEALPALRKVAAEGYDTTSAQAHLLLAQVAEREGALDDALAYTDQGLGRLTRYAARLAAADLLLPELCAERAFVLAALGRSAEAAAEAGALNPAYPFLARARYRVRLMTLVQRGDLAAAARLADESALDLPLNPRDELLGDAARVAASPESSGAGEVSRVKDELRTQAELRRWLTAVAPELLRAAELAAEGGDDDAEAEREARAEAEAAGAPEAARLLG